MNPAMHAMAAGDFAGALSLLEGQVKRDPGNVAAWLNLAATRRQLEQYDGAFAALRAALRLDGRNFPALLMNASLLERLGRIREAAVAYGIALAQAPPGESSDAATARAVQHGRAVHGKYVADIHDYVLAATQGARQECDSAAQSRLEAFIGTTLRVRRQYTQQPLEYFYPGMPTIEFYDRGEFPWLEEFEASSPRVREELLGVLSEDAGGFSPYIHYPDHEPLDQWRTLNHSPLWTSYNFFEAGTLVPDRCARAPETLRALAALPQPIIPRRSPCAMYSLLRPRTRIPPHTGIANFRLVVHLPLILPGDCGFRVGGSVQQWRLEEAWVFDDTIEHEAWNDSDEIRVILICDIWSPHLSLAERAAITRIIAAADSFRPDQPGLQI
jgi:aspartate beta-hydroxylase